MSDAIGLLKADHKKVKELFKEANELSHSAAVSRAKLFDQIKTELELHTFVEETIFYPAFKAKSKASSEERDEVMEAYEEHAAAKDLIAKLAALDPKDETYKAKLQVLSEMIDHHVKEEESEMFPQARKFFDPDELRQLGDEMAAAKEAAQDGVPA